MNHKLSICKSCGHEIAKSAKTCPQCGAKNKKRHPVLFGIIALFVLIGMVGSMGDQDTPEKVETPYTALTEAGAVSKKDEITEFGVGETAELKGIQVTFVNAAESTGSDFNQPTDGNVFVLCEFEIVNNSDKEINISSMMSFEAYCDDYACTFSLAALMEKGSKNQLDGTVAAGKKFNGVIGYEVPTDWNTLEIRFTPDFWSGKEIIFVANT